jgi:hypothetical protein
LIEEIRNELAAEKERLISVNGILPETLGRI